MTTAKGPGPLLYGKDKVQPIVIEWLARHPAAAARDLIPLALGPPGTREAARGMLRMLRALDQQGHRDVVRAAAAAHGSRAAEAVDRVLGFDPLQVLPARIPERPAWFDPAQLPHVLLKGGSGALPPVAVGHLCTMLAISSPGAPYAGVDLVREAVEPASLAVMAWGLFERWGAAGYPPRAGWVLNGLGLGRRRWHGPAPRADDPGVAGRGGPRPCRRRA